MDKLEPSRMIYTPAESSTIALQGIEQAKKNEIDSLPLPLLADYFAPLSPGELCIVQGQTSNGKSLFLQDWERKAAEWLTELKRHEVIIHVSVEDMIETQIYYELGQYTGDRAGDLARGKVIDWDALQRAAIQIGTVPIYRIGASLARAEDIPYLHLGNILIAIDFMLKGGLGERMKPAGIFIDYLQALPFDPDVAKTELDGQRRLQVRQDIYRAKQASAKFRCPIILAAQSKQHLTGNNPPLMIPGIYDVEETSAAGQRPDRNISLWMPKMSYPVGKKVPLDNGTILEVTEDLIYVKVNKQRGGLPSGKIFPCRVDYTSYTIQRTTPQAIQTTNPNEPYPDYVK